MKLIFLSSLLLFAFNQNCRAQVDTVNAQNNKLQVKNLKEGTVNYLVYTVDSITKVRTTGDIWRRQTQFTTFMNHETVTFTWNWLRHDTSFATIVNICDRKSLAPIHHHANFAGRGITAFDFRNGMMVPSDTVKNNLGKERGNTLLSIPVISWEQDLETYPLLPINKVGQKFEISFFDPNEKVPAYHLYEVIGQEELVLNDDTRAKCWLLKINYMPGSYAVFWLADKSKEVLKMKEFFNGKYRFKVRLY